MFGSLGNYTRTDIFSLLVVKLLKIKTSITISMIINKSFHFNNIASPIYNYDSEAEGSSGVYSKRCIYMNIGFPEKL